MSSRRLPQVHQYLSAQTEGEFDVAGAFERAQPLLRQAGHLVAVQQDGRYGTFASNGPCHSVSASLSR